MTIGIQELDVIKPLLHGVLGQELPLQAPASVKPEVKRMKATSEDMTRTRSWFVKKESGVIDDDVAGREVLARIDG